ncbi:metallopeptidase TldD-related protein [Streptomyces sp. MI02-7b]|uniref:metallopeptidase TldD-related protein n=1 Tax=Streptomyces sp. MI02-7b TaxID=462941 RepID=UPI0029AC288D|nr:metallopeptidase TldD-related protein [Streptomyces sp. MI02-7b]MDX3078370.1 metallopeptidase TldD-related protein [Streptomyces sp. MI02-7b]
MTASALELCERVANSARPGERVEVFARHVRSTLSRLRPGSDPYDQIADGWLVGVRIEAGGLAGLATGNVLSPSGLAELLVDARRSRAMAPAPVVPSAEIPPAPPALTPTPDDNLASTRDIALTTRSVLGAAEPATITAGSTHRTVLRCDSTGWTGSYTQREAQLHIRSTATGLDAAQGARIREQLSELSPADAIDEYLHSRDALAGHPVVPDRIDWILLSPLVVARVVSRLSRAFVRPQTKGRALDVGAVVSGGSPLTIVDDAGPGSGLGRAPFDDEGMPRRRTVLLSKGVVVALLGCRDAGPSTGSAYWGDWDSDITSATARCHVEPTCDDSAPVPAELPGTGIVVVDVRGFRGGFDLLSGNLEFEVAGALLRDGEFAGSARTAVVGSPDAVLGAFEHVYRHVEFYRMQGLYGGSWSLLNGSVAQL